MDAKEFLNKELIPDITIRGKKPKGQFPEYRGLLSEIMEEYYESKLKNNGVLDGVAGQVELLKCDFCKNPKPNKQAFETCDRNKGNVWE